MSKHLQNDLNYLEQDVLALSSIVEDMIDIACRALREHRGELVNEVMHLEPKVNFREIRIEEECLKILALHQPVAVDLRRVTTVLKINAELERIADLAVNIGERTESLAALPTLQVPDALDRMATLTSHMVHDSLDSFVNQDVDLARAVCNQDNVVDEYNVEVIYQLRQTMRANGDAIEAALHFFSASRQIERIGDHATNIAEDVLYLVEGEISRHQDLMRNARVG